MTNIHAHRFDLKMFGKYKLKLLTLFAQQTVLSPWYFLNSKNRSSISRFKKFSWQRVNVDHQTLLVLLLSFLDIHWSKWSTWSAWSKCTGQCNQGYGTSEQTRTRARTCIGDQHGTQTLQCTGDTTETDKRPCNAVELYGIYKYYEKKLYLSNYGVMFRPSKIKQYLNMAGIRIR